LPELRIAGRRADMTVAVDDAGRDELSREIDDSPTRRWRHGRAEVVDAPVLLTMVTFGCAAAPLPSISVALVRAMV
jgi:hypothetical protein